MKKLPEPTSLKDMQDQTMVEKVSSLLAQGMSQTAIIDELGWSRNKLYRLLDKYPEIVRGVHDDVRKRAVLMRHRTLSRLQEISEQDENLNAAVRACDALDSRAGLSFDRKEAGVTVQIFGEAIHVGQGGVTGMDLRALAEELAGKLKLDRGIIDAEFSLDPARTGAVGNAGGGATSAPPGHQAGAGPEEVKPAPAL